MQSVICTLFEGNYHYGVAAWTNSICRSGFKGPVYAGYRGKLPSWASNAKENTLFDWPGSTVLQVSGDVQLYFLPLDTDYHLTNYKPDFMLRLLSGPALVAKAIYYFDPDIVVVGYWSTFEDWKECGIALCEDINSPLPKYHLRRMGWRNHYAKSNIILNFKDATYVNGGFIGLSEKDFGFLNTWRSLQELMAPLIGGLDNSLLTGGKPLPKELKDSFGRFAPFAKTDQDALNAAVEVWDGPVSYIGKEGMGFIPGFPIMLHALGNGKPWQGKTFRKLLSGDSPRFVDKAYWRFVHRPIKVYPSRYIVWKQLTLIAASFAGRFYSRNN